MYLIDSGNPIQATKPNDDRRNAADVKQDLPAVRRHQHGGDEAGNGAAERHAADREDGQSRAHLPRRGFGVDGNRVGDHAADTDAGEEPQPEHLREVGREGGGQGEHAEDDVRPDQRRLAAEAVADPAEESRSEENADEAGAEDRPERAWLQSPLFDKARRGESDRRDVVAVDQHHEKRPSEQLDLE